MNIKGKKKKMEWDILRNLNPTKPPPPEKEGKR